MCGHVGIAGALAAKDEGVMKRLLILDYFRGPDSTGLAAIETNGHANIAKIASNPVDLFDMNKFKTALSGAKSKAFIGHNRLATRGVVNNINAHPYQFDHIVGAHNGTLETGCKWALEDALDEKFDVDSQALFAAIARLGVENVIPMLRSSDNANVSSAWALVWYDQNQNSLNFLRNQHRPLWYGYDKECKRLFWASQWEIIDSAVKIGQTSGAPTYEMFVEEDTNYKYWPFDDDIHYRFDLDALKEGGSRPKPKVKELKGKEPAPASTGVMGDDPFGRSPMGFHGTPTNTSTASGSTTTSHGSTTLRSRSKKVDLVHLFGCSTAPYAGYISEKRFTEFAKFGCGWCGTSLFYGEPGVTIYDRDDLILCPGCSGYEEGDESATRIYVKDSQLQALL